MLKKAIIILLIGLSTFAMLYFVSSRTLLFRGMERSLLKGFFFMREPDIHEHNPLVSQEVMLLGFDEEAIASIGKWPWHRNVHARVLNKLEKFSPRTVIFDVVFVKSETLPPFITEKWADDPNLLEKAKKTFLQMDQSFATALGKYNNVFLDVQLVANPRPDLPKTYQDRIRYNEEILKKYSLPLTNNSSLVSFYSLEPVLNEFISNAHPAIVNVLSDDDGVTRMIPLYYTYKMMDGSFRNLFTVTLSMIQRYYRVATQNVSIQNDKITLTSAKIPVLDPFSCQIQLFAKDFDAFKENVLNPVPPESYRYNHNLFNLIHNRLRIAKKTDPKVPLFSLHVLKKREGFEILEGWEIYDAAQRGGAKKIRLVVYEEGNVEIKTPIPGFCYINYAGREKRYFVNPQTGVPEGVASVPTKRYSDIYAMEPLPEIPKLNASGRIEKDYDLRPLEQWFYAFCEKQSYKLHNRAARDLGDAVQDDQSLLNYMNNLTDEGRYFFYAYYFMNTNAAPGMLRTLIAQYPDFGMEVGQEPSAFLSEKCVVTALMNAYAKHFEHYYNKFVFAGATALILGDVQQTPYGAMNGINTLVSAFNTLVTRNQLRMSAHLPYFDSLLLLGFALFFSFAYGYGNIRIGSFVFIVTLVGTFASGLLLFSFSNFFLTTTPLVFLNIFIFSSMIILKVLTERKDKKFLKTTFSNYLSPEIIDEMYQNKTMPTLGGEARSLTAYFTDIQGFSTFSEKLTAQQLVELINEYLSEMTDLLMAESGTLDKYEGDAIIAFFGAPMVLPDHAFRACNAAVLMQRKLADLQEKWRNEKQNPHDPDRNTRSLSPEEWQPGDKWPLIVHDMKMRIGINSGEIVVGNMGSAMRMNYTMMGDAVNLAARLEAVGKQYGIYVIASEATLQEEVIDRDGKKKRVFDMMEVRYIDTIAVAGKSIPVRAYELCALKGDLSDREKVLIEKFDQGIAHYLEMNWEQAIPFFEETLKIERFPDAKITPSKLYIDRCRAYMENPPVSPGEGWDCVCRLTKK